MLYKELKGKNEAELKMLLAESQERLRDLNFKDASKQLKNIREIRVVKKTIARILTLLNQSKQA